MEEPITFHEPDSLLHLFLSSATNLEAEDHLAALIVEHTDPIVSRIIRMKLRVSLKPSQGDLQNQDGLELAGDLRAAIISELLELRAQPEQKVIINFRHYVAMRAYSACADYFRGKHPQRWRLKNMLRHHLKQSEQFAIWEVGSRRWLCGLSPWRNENTAPCSLERLRTVVEGHETHPSTSLPSGEFARQSPANLLAFVFDRAGRPIELDHLVTIVADIWNVRDLPVESYDDGRLSDSVEEPTPPIDKMVEERSHLDRLWREVKGLPALQRAALLLNLRDADGGSVIAFIPHLGIASKKEIAELALIPYGEFLELWNDLPLDDSTLAERLGLSRQQVINLRKTARERLARRMAALEKNSRPQTSRGNT